MSGGKLSDDQIAELTAIGFPKLVRIAFYQSIAIFVLGVGLILSIYLAVTKAPLTFAISESGRVIPLIPLDRPMVSDSRVIGFSDECLRSAFSHDFLNARISMARASECFTADGNAKFIQEISPLLADIEKKRMVMTPTLEPAVIVKTNKIGGIWQWDVQTKMTLYRRGTSTQIDPQTFVVSMLIKRVPLEDNVRGIGVEQINVRPG